MYKFKTGDIVVALNSKDCNINPRVQGKEYRVIGSAHCPDCHEEMVCINETHFPKTFKIKCAACKGTSMQSNHVWTLASNFRAKEIDHREELQIALRMEDYMRAAELRDLINSKEKQSN